MNNTREIDPYGLDWGEIFVESYNTITKNATLIYNFDFEPEGMIQFALDYSIGHIFWVFKNLPTESSITAIYDLRGRQVNDSTIIEFEEKIRKNLSDKNSSLILNITYHR